MVDISSPVESSKALNNDFSGFNKWQITNIAKHLNKARLVNDFKHNELLDLVWLKKSLQKYFLEDGYNLIIANGQFLLSLSNLPDARFLDICVDNKSIEEAPTKPLSVYNQQHLLACVSLLINEGLDKPLNIVYCFDDNMPEGSVVNYKQVIKVASNAKLDCREMIINLSDKNIKFNLVNDCLIKEHAVAKFSQQQIASNKIMVWQTNTVKQLANSNYYRLDWLLGSQISYLSQFVDLAADDCKCEINAAIDLSQDQQLYCPVEINHLGKNTVSLQNFCAIAKDQASGVVNSKVNISHSGCGSVAKQVLRGLLLNDQSSLVMSPELEIDIDEVECHHGASVGALDKAGLLYLQSRGFEMNKAKMLMMEALFRQLFANDSDFYHHGLAQLLLKWTKGVDHGA